jgi:formylglycine-generating enzyme required for sulfatase activity
VLQPDPERRHVFISYSHADRGWVERIRQVMAPLLMQQGKDLQLWDDSQIEPGDRWLEEIEAALANARVALLLVSVEFLASEFVMGQEVPALLRAAEADGVRVLWVPLSASLVRHTAIHAYQALLPPEQALDALDPSQQRQALVRIAEAVHKAVEQAEAQAQRQELERRQEQQRRERQASAAAQRQQAWEEARQRQTKQRAAQAAERQRRQQEAAAERQRLLDDRAERRRLLIDRAMGPLRAWRGGLQGSLSRRQVLVAGAWSLAGIAASQFAQRLGQPAAHRQKPPTPTPTPRTRPAANLQGPQSLRLSQGWLEGEAKGWPLRRRPIEVQAYSEILATGVTLRMIAIRAGDFIMGSPAHEALRQEDEGPQHRVTLEGFLLGQTPITQAQWRQVASWPPAGRALNADPSAFKGADRPVERVSWEEAMEFCRRLSRDTGRSYTLPSEAQWEYACRAGSTTPFAFGETLATELANYDGRDTYPSGRGSYGNGPKGLNRGQTTPVGMFPPNAWGLQDMHGNVREWCLDFWHDSYAGAPADGTAWVSGGEQDQRLLRGGSWYDGPGFCRSAYRFLNRPGYANGGVGFRVVCLP